MSLLTILVYYFFQMNEPVKVHLIIYSYINIYPEMHIKMFRWIPVYNLLTLTNPITKRARER